MEEKNVIPILQRAIDILEYIGAVPHPVSMPELQRQLGIPQASCYRIVNTLLRRGWLKKCCENTLDIASGVDQVAAKVRFRLENYRMLQPILNRLFARFSHPVKFSVLDQEHFVNVCVAKPASGGVAFSDPGFSSDFSDPASAGTIFLAEMEVEKQRSLVHPERWNNFTLLLDAYRKNNYCFISGKAGTAYPLDTLSFPVRKSGTLLGVLSLLAFAGELEPELPVLTKELSRYQRHLATLL